LPQKILGQSYEKLRIRSDLGTSEENLMLNLRKTFDQCSIRSFGSSFGSANYPLHPQIFPANLLRKLPVTTFAHPQIRTSAFYPRPVVPGQLVPILDNSYPKDRSNCTLVCKWTSFNASSYFVL